MRLIVLPCLVLALGLSCFRVHGDEASAATQASLTSQTAQTGSGDCSGGEPGWTEIEKNLWTQLCRTGTGNGVLVPKELQDASSVRQPVSAAFLVAILQDDAYRKRIGGRLDLAGIRILGRVYLHSTKLAGDIRIWSSQSTDGLYLDSVDFEGSLQLSNVCVPFLWIENSRMQGNLTLDQRIPLLPRCLGFGLKLTQTDISGGLDIEDLSLTRVDLTQARIGKDVRITGSSVQYLSLQDAVVGGRVTLKGLTVKRPPSTSSRGQPQGSELVLNLDGLKASSTVDLTDASIDGPVSISDASIDGSLVFAGASIAAGVNVSGTHITKAFVVGAPVNADSSTQVASGSTLSTDSKKSEPSVKAERVLWGPQSSLTLTNTSVGVIQTPYDLLSWPPRMDLTNLTFSAFMGRSGAKKGEKLGDWFKEWLSRSNDPGQPFNPQPYETVSHYLTSAGQSDAAEKVGVEEKDLERIEACGRPSLGRCLVMWASKYLVKYGYAPWLSMYWALGFIVVGALVFRTTDEAKGRTVDVKDPVDDESAKPKKAPDQYPIGLAYSFDTFIPVIKLRERHYKIDIAGPARYYFYLHKIMGWVIGSFLVAALSGLTK
jgi:hypothetical protein